MKTVFGGISFGKNNYFFNEINCENRLNNSRKNWFDQLSLNKENYKVPR